MPFIICSIEDHIAHLTLDRGKSNAIHLELVEELIQALRQAEANPAVEGIILHGKENFFSSGLDLIVLYDYDEQEMRFFWSQFLLLIRTLIAFPKPAVAAISGHSPAAGCVLGLCCDYRVMASGNFIIGLNEVPVGIIVPESIFDLYSFWIGRRLAYQYVLEGKLLNPEQALEIGLIDELVAPQRIRTAALRKVKSLCQFEKKAWQTTKLNLRKSLIQATAVDPEETITQVLQQWWTPDNRSILKTIIESLTHHKKEGLITP